jgi:hypothetical protein
MSPVPNPLTIPIFHDYVRNNAKSLEATCRFVLDQTVHLECLQSPNTEFLDRLVLAASNWEERLIPIDLLDDICIMCAMESDNYILGLYRAVGTAISFDSSQSESDGCRFIFEVKDSAEKLLECFQTGEAFAMRYAKYLLPVLVESSSEERMNSHVLPSLIDCVKRNPQSIPVPACYFIFELILDRWFSEPNCSHLLNKLEEIVTVSGVDSELAILISRCVFDLCCDDMSRVREFFKRLLLSDHSPLVEIMMSGAITGGL